MLYRVYFPDHNGHFIAAQYIEAPNDIEACIMGNSLYDACSDVVAGFEVWDRARRVIRRDGNAPWQYVTLSDALSALRQSEIIRHEEILWRSYECIRRSQRLLETRRQLDAPALVRRTVI